MAESKINNLSNELDKSIKIYERYFALDLLPSNICIKEKTVVTVLNRIRVIYFYMFVLNEHKNFWKHTHTRWKTKRQRFIS